ncbi:cytochrome P450 oxidoreductase [Peniophora sp. CONT]|nr:cytochrome P450 oxidoreductase [Peniophora sp. CONT]
MLSTGVMSLILVLLLPVALAYLRKSGRHPLPPGPWPLPLIGNLLDLPRKDDWLHWLRLGDRYGPLIFVRVLGTPMVIVNKLDMCIDMLERRSAVYSGRPLLTFAGKMVGWDRQMLLAEPDERHRKMRRMTARHFGTRETAAAYRSAQEDEARLYLLAIDTRPHEIIRHIRWTVSSVFLRISHGYKTEREGTDPLIALVARSARDFHVAIRPGAWLVDVFPCLARLPAWLPGTGFKRVASDHRATLDTIMTAPLEFVKTQMANNEGVPSFSSRMLQSDLDELERELLPNVSAALYAAGPDTVSAALSTFVLAMLLYPDIQRQAQDELDETFGGACIPPSDELSSLFYLRAVVLEVLRWHTVACINIPHFTLTSDSFESYYIPKGTAVLANLQAFAYDETHYQDPTSFKPARFLGSSPELDPMTFAFGFGRRRCPGSGLALELLTYFMAVTLSVFDVIKLRDQDGAEITPVPEFESGAVCPPKPFPCGLRPRSADAEALLRALRAEHKPEASDAAKLRL